MEYKCAYCGKQIMEDSEVFLIRGKMGPEVDLREDEGQMISTSMSRSNKNIPAIAPRSDSDTKMDGFDIGIIVCSEDCAKYLKNDLQTEISGWMQRKSETRRSLESFLKSREGVATTATSYQINNK